MPLSAYVANGSMAVKVAVNSDDDVPGESSTVLFLGGSEVCNYDGSRSRCNHRGIGLLLTGHDRLASCLTLSLEGSGHNAFCEPHAVDADCDGYFETATAMCGGSHAPECDGSSARCIDLCTGGNCADPAAVVAPDPDGDGHTETASIGVSEVLNSNIGT